MARPFAFLLLLGAAAPAPARAQIPTPAQFFGFTIGADRKLARWDRIVEYFQLVGRNSDRVRVRTLGPTTQNNPFIVAEVASPATLKDLERYKQLEKKLYFQGGTPTEAERDEIFAHGKAVVVITTNVHATEIGASQMAVEAIYRLATDDSPAMRKILDNVIFLFVPSLNPDGQIMVTDWYNKYLGTPYEASQLPYLYHYYVGHDNNRDMYNFSQKESRLTAELLWHDWFPSVWLDEHQQGSSGARIFTMPATDPINPNVHPLIYRLNGILGQQQSAALEAEGKTGIIYNSTYTNYWQGAMAWSGWWHNQVGLLTEVASARIATPIEQRMADPSRPAPAPAGDFMAEMRRMMENPAAPLPPPTDITPRTEYPRPWLGGTWRLRDIVDYELAATFALLEAAADRRETLLRQIYEINRTTIEAGAQGSLAAGERAFAAIIPADQHDLNEAVELVDRLLTAGVEVHRARAAFQQDGVSYPAGSWVVPFNQVFGRYAKDILEKQTYPEVRRAPNAPAEPPYDVSAWSLGMQFGVRTVMARTALPTDLALERVAATPRPVIAAARQGGGWSFPYSGAESARLVNRLLKEGARVSLAGATVVTSGPATAWARATEGYEVRSGTGGSTSETRPLRMPRIGLYQSWTANMDEGWTRWVLERYAFPYTILHNADIRAGGLKARFDAIVLPDQRPREMVDGYDFSSVVPEYRGGLGEEGVKALTDFATAGGTLVALGAASDLLIDRMPLPVRDLKRGTTMEQHFAPGTVVNLQVDPSHPLGRGMPESTWGFYVNSPFFQLTEGFQSQRATVAARYPNTGVNASGWLRGEDYMTGRGAVVAVEFKAGRVVLFGIRPQHRAQTHAMLPMFFNALYWSVE